MRREDGPSHPQAGKFGPDFLAGVAKHLTEAAQEIDALRDAARKAESALAWWAASRNAEQETHAALAALQVALRGSA